jgi:putative thioredoxin
MANVHDVSEAQFEAQVLAKSRELPVVVDFWAAWCAPCRMLGPVLEREVEALGGRVMLAKVDVDEAQALAQQFNVRGIPAVMAFRDGRVVAEFTGARDGGFVRSWLAELAPSPQKAALERASTVEELQALAKDPEVGAAAKLKLAERLLADGKPAEAEELLRALPATDHTQALLSVIGFARDAAAFGGEAKAREALQRAPKDVEARWALASALAAKGELSAALEGFLELVTTNRKFRDDGARKAMLALFDLAGQKSDLTREFRRRLTVVL